jgi:hypothetical protein
MTTYWLIDWLIDLTPTLAIFQLYIVALLIQKNRSYTLKYCQLIVIVLLCMQYCYGKIFLYKKMFEIEKYFATGHILIDKNQDSSFLIT